MTTHPVGRRPAHRVGGGGAWREAVVPLMGLAAVAATLVPSVVAMIIFEQLLPGDFRTEALHVVNVAASVFVWGATSSGIVAGAAWLIRGHARALRRADAIWAIIALATIAGWTIGLQLWAIDRFGRIDLDMIPVARLWPAVAILAVVELLPLRNARMVGWSLGVVLAVGAIALLALELLSSIVGALPDGSVSPWGLVVGALAILQVSALALWFLSILRERRSEGGH